MSTRAAKNYSSSLLLEFTTRVVYYSSTRVVKVYYSSTRGSPTYDEGQIKKISTLQATAK